MKTQTEHDRYLDLVCGLKNELSVSGVMFHYVHEKNGFQVIHKTPYKAIRARCAGYPVSLDDIRNAANLLYLKGEDMSIDHNGLIL